MQSEMRYVYEIYKERSFSKAAKNLFVSQPAISASIKKIEERLGAALFDRNSKPLALTEVGEIYINAIEEIMQIETNMENNIHDLSELKSGKLVIAGANFFSSYVIPPILKAFINTYPGIEVELTESDSIDLYNKSLDQNIDLIVDGGTYDNEHFAAHHLIEENILLAVPKNNPLNSKLSGGMSGSEICSHLHLQSDVPYAELKSFAAERFILLKKGHDMHDRSLKICSNNDFRPKSALHLNQLMTAFNLARQEIGIVFVTDTLVSLNPARNSMVYYKVKSDYSKRDIFIAHKKNVRMTKPMKMFIKTSKSALRNYLDSMQNELIMPY